MPTGTTGGGTTTGGPTATTGKIQLNLKQITPRGIPSGFTSVRITGYDASNNVLFTQTQNTAPTVIQGDVPVSVVTVKLEFLDASGKLVGQSNLPVTITANGTFVIDDPAYDNVVTTVSTDFLNGSFTLTGADSGTVKGGVLNGTLTFDGAGRVTGGNLTRRDATAQATTTPFSVTAGSYTIANDRSVDITLTTNRYPLKLRGRASLNTVGQSVYADIFGDNGSNDALSGFAYLQKNGVADATVTPGTYNISGMSVGFFGTPGIYNGNLTLSNGTVGAGSLDGPAGGSLPITGGTYSVAGGSLSGTMQIAGLGNLAFSGTVGSDHYITFNGISSTSNDFLYFAGIPTQPPFSLPNVPGTMNLVGMRTANGGLDGTASLSIGAGQLLGGTYLLYQAVTVPIIPSSSTLTQSTFNLSPTGIVTGTSGAGATVPVRLVRGFFSQDGSVYFGSLDSPQGALAGGQGFCVLAK